MKSADLNVRVQNHQDMHAFIEMAKALGYSAIVTTLETSASYSKSSDIMVHSRLNLQSRKLSSLKNQIANIRGKYDIVAIPLAGVEITNWAAEDPRVDMIVVDPTEKHILRRTTAGLSADHGTILEIPISPLLTCTGIERSRILRVLRDAVSIAVQAKMTIALSSGANLPIHMRSPVSLYHIGMILGLDKEQAKEAVLVTPASILIRNAKRKSSSYLGPGIEIVQEDNEV
ncbi:MAG: RNase P subunit p30 family protein [Candidatus Thorarchaeota archaeon]